MRQSEISFQDLLVEALCVLVLERKITADFGEEDYACTPEVRFLTHILFSSNELWCSVAR
jgi:hypothetical protein